MRSPAEIEAFEAGLRGRVSPGRLAYESAMFRACVPEPYWFVKSSDVKHNVEVFANFVQPYRNKLKLAYNEGYGLLFIGDNGAGKTMFMSYLLGRAVHGGFSAYYTTALTLDANLKRAFANTREAQQEADRLKALLFSDFLVIDELGRETVGKGAWVKSQIEDLLKRRYDEKMPTLLASNLDQASFNDMVEATVVSMINGRYRSVHMESGDYRKKTHAEMRQRMGYK